VLTQEGAVLDADALFAPLAGDASLVLAVSGGPDSVALMLLAARWALRAEKTIVVATVDHGLREGSRHEAQTVGEWARALGFAYRVLVWEGEKPRTRVQERAREARYALLAQCAREVGAGVVVAAHHADDQAETVLFRLTRGSGVAGLAGMAARGDIRAVSAEVDAGSAQETATKQDSRARLRSILIGDRSSGVALARPLLGVDKTALEAECARAKHPFFRDPSNQNPAFARVKLRALRETLAAQGLDRDALLRLARRAAQAEEALAWSAAQTSEAALLRRDGKETRFDAGALRAAPREILQRVVGVEIARLAAPERLRLDALERAAQTLAEALSSNKGARITLAGAALRVESGALVVARAPPRRRSAGEKPPDA